MLSDVLHRLPALPEPMPLPDDVRHYLVQNQVPADIIEDLARSSYFGWIPVGPVDVIPMFRLVVETTGIAVCMQHGYLPVAGCRNGDPVVVHRETRRISYVSHDILWDEERSDIRECMRESPYLYEEFWNRAFTDPEMPGDYYEACERWDSTGSAS